MLWNPKHRSPPARKPLNEHISVGLLFPRSAEMSLSTFLNFSETASRSDFHTPTVALLPGLFTGLAQAVLWRLYKQTPEFFSATSVTDSFTTPQRGLARETPFWSLDLCCLTWICISVCMYCVSTLKRHQWSISMNGKSNRVFYWSKFLCGCTHLSKLTPGMQTVGHVTCVLILACLQRADCYLR